MGTQYTSTTVTTYNQSPPSDDGQTNAANEIEWQKHLDNIGGPLKTTIESINTKLLAHLDNGPDDAKSSNYTIVASDYGKLIRCTATLTLTVTASLGTGFTCTIKNDSASGQVTISPAGGDTIDDSANISLSPNQWAVIHGDETSSNYSIISNNNATGAITLPAGIVMAWPDTEANIPANDFLYCDGDAVSRTTYSELFNVIGVKYGNGDGSTTFNLPDYRGEFLRGLDDTASNDPDAASRTDRGDGTTGDNVGTKQDHQLDSHTHNANARDAREDPTGGNEFAGLDGGSDNPDLITDPTGGNETRPRNVAVLYVISTGKLPIAPNIINILPTDRPILSINATDTEHDIDFAAGKISSDDGTLVMVNSAMTKSVDTPFSSGTNQGGWPSGLAYPSINRTTIHVFEVSTPGGITDFGFDTSVTAVNLLADTNIVAGGYTKKRRVASLLLDASNNWVGFVQYGSVFMLDSVYTFKNVDPGTTPDIDTTGGPTVADGLEQYVSFYMGTGGSSNNLIISHPTVTTRSLIIVRSEANSFGGSNTLYYPCDALGRLTTACSFTGSTVVGQIIGWRDQLDLA